MLSWRSTNVDQPLNDKIIDDVLLQLYGQGMKHLCISGFYSFTQNILKSRGFWVLMVSYYNTLTNHTFIVGKVVFIMGRYLAMKLKFVHSAKI